MVRLGTGLHVGYRHSHVSWQPVRVGFSFPEKIGYPELSLKDLRNMQKFAPVGNPVKKPNKQLNKQLNVKTGSWKQNSRSP